MVKKITNLLVWLTSGVLLMASLTFVALATPLVGNRALIVRSGSMEPAISVGDIVIVRPGTYQTGDAIAYNVPGKEGMVVTHRIVELKQGEYVTKGDANAEADSWVITNKDILGKELFTVPWVGTLLAFAKSRIGFLSLVVAPALVVVLSEARVIWREMRGRVQTPSISPLSGGEHLTPVLSLVRRGSTSPDKGSLGGVLNPVLSFVGAPPPPIRRYVDGISMRLAVIIFMVAIMTPATFALYTDTGTSANNVFTAADDFGGFEAGDVVINEIMWMGSTASTNDEWIELRNLTSNPIDLAGWEIVNAGAGGSPIITLTGTIPANGYFLISDRFSTHPQSALNDALTVDQQESNLSFDNDGEQLTLQDGSAAIIDRTPVPPPAWSAGVNSTNKQSMQRIDPPSDGTIDGNWFTCTNAGCNDTTFWDAEGNNYGTPKAANL